MFACSHQRHFSVTVVLVAPQNDPNKQYCSQTTLDPAFQPFLPDILRAEFDGFLKEKAALLGIPTLSTANQIFELFDEAGGGILHITDLAAGLAVLCDGSLARSVRYACRLYRGPDGDMGFLDIYGFALSIFKVRPFEPQDLSASTTNYRFWPEGHHRSARHRLQ